MFVYIFFSNENSCLLFQIYLLKATIRIWNRREFDTYVLIRVNTVTTREVEVFQVQEVVIGCL